MKKLSMTLAIALMCTALTGCIIVPERPAYYSGGCYHCWH